MSVDRKQEDLLEEVFKKIGECLPEKKSNYWENGALEISEAVYQFVVTLPNAFLSNQCIKYEYLYPSNIEKKPSYISGKTLYNLHKQKESGKIMQVNALSAPTWCTLALFVNYFGWKGFRENLTIEKGIERFSSKGYFSKILIDTKILRKSKSTKRIDPKRNKRIYAVLLLSILICISGFIIYKWIPHRTISRDSKDSILILTFEGDVGNSYQIDLANALDAYFDGNCRISMSKEKVDYLLDIHLGHETARKIGLTNNASIVVWGHVVHKSNKVIPRITLVNKPTNVFASDDFLKNEYTFSPSINGEYSFPSNQLRAPIAFIKFIIGAYYIMQGNYELALNILNEIENEPILLETSQSDLSTLLGYCFLMKTGGDRRQNLNKGKDYFEDALMLNPSSKDAKNGLGMYYLFYNDFVNAELVFRNIIEQDSNNFSIWYNLGFIYSHLDSILLANNSYKKAVDINPKSSSAWENLAFTHLSLGNYSESINAFQKALELDNNCVNCLFGLGRVYEINGNNEKALKLFKEAIRIDPKSVDALPHLAQYYFHQENYSESISYYKRGLNEDLQNYKVLYNLGKAYEINGNTNLAFKTYKKTIEFDSLLYPVWRKLGYLSYIMNNEDSAFYYYKKAISINPTYYELLYELGRLYYNNEEIDSAAHFFDRASSIFLSAETQIGLGQCFILKNNLKMAEFHLNEAIDLGEKEISNLFLGQISLMKKEKHNAIKYFQLSLKNSKTKEDFLFNYSNLLFEFRNSDLTRYDYRNLRDEILGTNENLND